MSHILFPSPFTRVPHPFAADYGQPRSLLPSVRPAVDWHSIRQSQYTLTSSAQGVPLLRFSPRPQRTTRPEPSTRKSTYRPTSSNQLMPIAQPLPLCSPPPPVSEEVFPSNPYSPSSPSPSSRLRSSSSRLIRPDSRIRRHQKKKSMGVPDLKPLSRNDPEIKGLYPIMEVEEELVDLSRTGSTRLRHLEGVSPTQSTVPSLVPSPILFPESPLYQLASARPSSQLLVPSPKHGGQDSHGIDADGDVAMSDETCSPQHLVTPSAEDEDPFALDALWAETVPGSPELLAQTTSKRDRTRRPPPLTLTHSYKLGPRRSQADYPYAKEGQDTCIVASPSRRDEDSPPLLSPLPVASPGVLNARRQSSSGKSPQDASPRTKRRVKEHQRGWLNRRACSPDSEIDLESAMEELLANAGERRADIFWLHELHEPAARSCGVSTSTSSSRSRSVTTSESDADILVSDLSVPRRRESRYSQASDQELAASFPLPPTRGSSLDSVRDSGPIRPPQVDDMGLDSILSCHGDDLLGSPIQILPVIETPRTPENHLISRISTPSPLPCKPTKERRAWMPKLSGDHSFLQAMSRGEEVSPDTVSITSPVESFGGVLLSPISQFSSIGSDSSGSSSSSTRSLPRRGALPDQWRRFGRKI